MEKETVILVKKKILLRILLDMYEAGGLCELLLWLH